MKKIDFIIDFYYKSKVLVFISIKLNEINIKSMAYKIVFDLYWKKFYYFIQLKKIKKSRDALENNIHFTIF